MSARFALQADLQHEDVAGGMPCPTGELGHGHHEDIWLLNGTLHVTLSTLFLSLSLERGQRPLCRPSHCHRGRLPFSRAERWCPAAWALGTAGAQLQLALTWEVGFDGLCMYRCSASVEKSLKIRVHWPHLGAILG